MGIAPKAQLGVERVGLCQGLVREGQSGGFEQAPKCPQSAQTQSPLVGGLRHQRGGGAQLAHVAADVLKAAFQRGTPSLVQAAVGLQVGGSGQRHMLRLGFGFGFGLWCGIQRWRQQTDQACQPSPPVGLGLGVQPQTVSFHPVTAHFDDGHGVARDGLHLQLAHGHIELARVDVTQVDGQLHHALIRGAHPHAHAGTRAGDVGVIQLDQAGAHPRGVLGGFPVQRRSQGGFCGGSDVAAQVHHHRLTRFWGLGRLVILEAQHGVAACRLERLHPLASLLAHPQCHAGGGQGALGRVKVGCTQAQGRMLAAVQGGDFGLHGTQCVGRDLKFQFDFLHGWHCPALARAQHESLYFGPLE